MGYSTNFSGELRFTSELSASQLAKLSKMLGADLREHPEWNVDSGKAGYVDLELTEDFAGLRWNGAEKTYFLVESVNTIIRQMRKAMPAFGLTGQLLAQGESIEDRWFLIIGDNGFAQKAEIAIKGQKVRCPHCDRDFMLESVA
jgi:hypothetical protein